MVENILAQPNIDVYEKIRRWSKAPDPIASEASQAYQRQREKPQRILHLESPMTSQGVLILPFWKGFELVKIGQRRDLRDQLPRGNSAHQVTFCVAEFRDRNGSILTTTIALKTFERANDAVADAVSNAKVLERGFNSTNPFGIVVDGKKGYILSPARTDVSSLDTLPWHLIQTGDQADREHFMDKLSQLGVLLARLHAKGINHSDAQLKNFWVTEDGEIEAIDWEAAHLFDYPPTPDQLLSMAVDDLRVLFKSTTGQYKEFPIPIFTGPRENQWFQFQQDILNFYLENLEKLLEDSGLFNEQYLECFTAIEDNIKRELAI